MVAGMGDCGRISIRHLKKRGSGQEYRVKKRKKA
jgi:hypothetical protein